MTIHQRLSILFTIVVGFLLGLTALIVYLSSSIQREDRFIQELRNRAITVADVVLRSDEFSEQELRTIRARFRNTLPYEFVGIFTPNFQPVFTTTWYSETEIIRSFDNTELRTALLATKRMQQVNNRDTQSVWVHFVDEGHDYILIAKAYDELGFQHLQNLGTILLSVVLLSLLGVYGIGWWFAGKALAPVEQMISEADTISVRNLSQRLSEGNGKDELSHLARTFNQLFARLDHAFHSQKLFVANSSHELRTPLTSMIGTVDIALSLDRTEDEYRKTLYSIRDDMERLKGLVSNLLLFSKAEAELAELPRTEVYLDHIVYRAVEDITYRYPTRNIHVTLLTNHHATQDADTTWRLIGHEDLLFIAVLNILDNACKYSQPDTSIFVELSATSDALSCTIRDQGMGISEKHIALLTQPFYRIEEQRSVQGSGIGLALVHTIILAHHGTLTIESTTASQTQPTPQSDYGTTVCITLPYGMT